MQRLKKFLVIDTETTGLKLSLDDIIEISCFEVIGDNIKEVITSLIKPDDTTFVSASSQKVHGISIRELEQAKTFKEIANKLILIFENYDFLVMHNAEFDSSFLNFAFRKNNIDYVIDKEKIIDTLKVSMIIFGEKCSLDNLCIKLNLDYFVEERKITKHRADVDTMILAKCFLKMKNIIKEREERRIFKLSKDNWWE